jgi:N6-L-threonylcarbamoyladenine synthase
MAHLGDPRSVNLPIPLKRDPSCHMSFSGLKTACLFWIHSFGGAESLSNEQVQNLCASLQYVITQSLCQKIERALDQTGVTRCVLSGGVAANAYFRQSFESLCHRQGVSFFAPSKHLCTDNGVMIAWALKERIDAGFSCLDSIHVHARWPLDSLKKESFFL